jgi:hypothetical protein
VPATERTDLSPEAEERIAGVIRSLVDDHVDRGVDLGRPFRCDSCDREQSPLGATEYGAYALCNDCLLEFTLSLARGEIENVAEYMTKRPDEPSSPPPSEPAATTRSRSVTNPPITARGDKLMPSNEPC